MCIQKCFYHGSRLLSGPAFPAGQVMHGIQVQHFYPIKFSQSAGKGAFASAAETDDGDLHRDSLLFIICFQVCGSHSANTFRRISVKRLALTNRRYCISCSVLPLRRDLFSTVLSETL